MIVHCFLSLCGVCQNLGGVCQIYGGICPIYMFVLSRIFSSKLMGAQIVGNEYYYITALCPVPSLCCDWFSPQVLSLPWIFYLGLSKSEIKHGVLSACGFVKLMVIFCHLCVGFVAGFIIKCSERTEVWHYLSLTTPSAPCALFMCWLV